MNKKKSFALIIILYNPSFENIKTIKSYTSIFNKVILIDNSDRDNIFSFDRVPNTDYIYLGGNLGIAFALNAGCVIAKKQGFNYVLTMDQDSKFDSDKIIEIISELIKLMDVLNYSMVGSAYGVQRIISDKTIIPAHTFITSGSILLLKSWDKVGGFTDKLFIDQVDHDFCFKLKRSGFNIGISPNLPLIHEVGNPSSVIIFNKKFISTNHNWVRRYYLIRNSLYLRNAYPEFSKPLRNFLKDILFLIIGIILIDKNKTKNIFAIFLGLIDYMRNRYGPFNSLK